MSTADFDWVSFGAQRKQKAKPKPKTRQQRSQTKQTDLADAVKTSDEARADMSKHVMTLAEKGDLDSVLKHVQPRAYLVDVRGPLEKTLLYLAARAGHVKLIEKLIELGSQAVDWVDWKKRTPLCTAASHGHVLAIEALIRLGSKAIDTPDEDGQTPMSWATQAGHVPVLEALIRLGSRAIDMPDKRGWTPMAWAAYCGRVDVVEALVQLGSKAIAAPWVGKIEPPISFAAQNGQTLMIRALVRLGSPVDLSNEEGDTLFHLTAMSLYKRDASLAAAIETLVQLGSKLMDTPNKSGWTPMYTAASFGRAGVIEALVRLGSKAINTVSNIGRTPLYAAARGHQEKAIKALKALGADPTIIPADAPETIRNTLAADLPEEEVLEIRRRVFSEEQNSHEVPHYLNEVNI